MRKIFLASVILTFFGAAITLMQISSCTKADCTIPACPTPKYQISGLYIGTYKTDQVNHEPRFYSFVIYPDGTLITKSKGGTDKEVYYGEGKWTLSGNTFKYTVTTINYATKVKQSGKLTYNDNGSLTNGTWKDETGDSGVFYTGTFPTMQRVN